ncbi:MAG: type II toxin-antitoxin system HicA family toxin [Bacteroidales bacterium]|jgi:predicted RNA binding protein YcfA (HicA-like mRNA interferase family)|nr:type II toxin-antitoxin system HicA family toxin [Bacteroidales bacterium]
MKRLKVIKHLRDHECELQREGSRHSLYINTLTGAMATVPRHPDIKEGTVRAICKQLGVPQI